MRRYQLNIPSRLVTYAKNYFRLFILCCSFIYKYVIHIRYETLRESADKITLEFTIVVL